VHKFIGLSLSLSYIGCKDRPQSCPDRYLCGSWHHTARASNEAGGKGIIEALAAAIRSSSTQTSSRTAVDYPAPPEPFAPSVGSGNGCYDCRSPVPEAYLNLCWEAHKMVLTRSKEVTSPPGGPSEAFLSLVLIKVIGKTRHDKPEKG